MKNFKLSKTSWLILTTGVFLVVLIGLGVTRSQQIKEQSALDEKIKTSQTIIDKLQTTELLQQVEDLQAQVEEEQTLLEEAKQRLNQTVVSADVTERFFDIADYSNVTVLNIGTSSIGTDTVDGVHLSLTTLTSAVQGDLYDIVDFVINLNHGYPTGFVKTTQISVPDPTGAELPTANIQMAVYSYEEK
ncbi:MAG: hypothetical protein A2137_08075 [Chloroflexi bacterium RBG_16_58_8]|nr:MAG: hypothetical protein A2137_08075 [Chloroflexi bacterium RBG_16_58_8]